MKSQWLITFRSVTYAQKGQKILHDASIRSILQRTPKSLSDRGCSYCLRLRRQDTAAAVALLKQHHAPFGRIFSFADDGAREERL